ncbi:hypothetical protein FRB90_012546 [Tulasnella sp. 427]|nr:hypothetical protein FRB90_012546 [Tulasnella sp. 427]
MPLAPSSTQGDSCRRDLCVLEVDIIQGSSTEKQSKLQSRATREKCTTSVTKLISVVEIIKREFPKALRSHTVNTNPDSKGGASIAPELFDIHQYNEVGCIEDLYPSAEEETHEERAERITSLLQGKNHPAVKRTPYMKITLSRQPVPALAGGGSATYQAPIPFKYSKAQKARAKKRAAKLATATGSEGGELSETDRRPAAAVESIIGNTGSIVI